MMKLWIGMSWFSRRAPVAANPVAAFPLAAYLVAACFAASVSPLASQDAVDLEIPPKDIGMDRLELRKQAQLRSLSSVDVARDFSFSDGLPASGITFRHEGTEDGGKQYKMVHYDHGNGLAVADVDGDELPDLYFVNQLGSNALYKNLGGGRFEDVTARAGVALADRVSVAASFADVDNDGDPDLYVTTVKMGNAFFLNDGSGRFRDVTADAGLEFTGHSSGAVFFDYDLDGRLDLFVTNVGEYTTKERGPGGYFVGHEDAFHGHLREGREERSLLYRNLGGHRFGEVGVRVGLSDESWSGDATFADLNGDRVPDLYVFNMQGDDHYYESSGEGFVDRTASRFAKTPWGSMGGKFFDYNRDGRLDLMLTDMHSDMSLEIEPLSEKLKADMQWNEAYLEGSEDNLFGNAFYENLGEGRMREISDLVSAENYWPWGMSVGDLNADGFEDVFVTASMSYPWRYGVNSMLLNVAGKRFVDAEFALGLEPRPSGMEKVFWFELDCSGADREHQHCPGRSGRVRVFGNLGSRASALFDLDQDGDLDIVTGEFHAAPQVLLSDLASKRPIRSLEISLVGSASNRDGLGATVRVHTADGVQMRYHDGKSGYLSQSSLPLYFGLGKAERVERVEVLWPSGIEQTVIDGITVGKRLLIREPQPAK